MTHKRYKVIKIEFHCDCGECEGEDAYVVVDELMTEEEFVKNPNDERILCDCDSQSNADKIVYALNRLAMN